MKNAGGVRLPLPLAFGQFLGSLGVGVGKAARQRWAMMQTESTVPTRAWPAYGYLASILNNAECPAMIIGGVADHVHILFELSRQACVAGLVGDLKASSSKWLKAQGVAGFAQASVVLRFQRQKGTPRAYPGPAFFMKNAAYPSAAKISGIGPTDVAPSVSLECR
jgi:hypothetical protein